MNKVRVLIVDDHPMLRAALRAAIEAEDDLEVIAEAGNGQAGVEHAIALRPDVTVMDLYLPLKDGVDAIAEITAKMPEARILAITSSTEDEKVVTAVQAGARGYLIKDASRETFLQALRTVASGGIFLPPDVAEKLTRGMRLLPPAPSLPNPAENLTRRELEVLGLVSEGLHNQAIAERLHLSESTVRVHIFNLINKLGLEDRNQLIRYTLRLP